MNAPHFNLDNLPVDVSNTGAYINAVLTEQHRVCDAIDARILEVENEYLAMGNELRVLALDVDNHGFFEQWKIRRKMNAIISNISLRRSMLANLYDARWRRTYA